MGGWISILGQTAVLESRLNRFIKTFSVDGVPHLKTEIHSESPAFCSLFWAWNDNAIPDVYISRLNDIILISCGVVTGLGNLGSCPPSQEATMRKILELWTAQGDGAIAQINGSFSFLFHDKKPNQTSLFTDRFASRSVWMAKDGNALIVGNFPSALAVMKQEKLKLDPAGLWSFFYAGRQSGRLGLFADVEALMAGEKAVVSDCDKISVTRWFHRKYLPENGVSPEDWGGRLADTLRTAAERYRKTAQSPYLFLSGGLDSRIVAGAFGRPMRALSLCTSPNAETRLASRVSRILGLDHEILVRSAYWYHDTLDASALISSGIYLNQHAHFMAPVQKVALADPDSEFFLGDLLENFNKHYFYLPPGAHLSFSPETVGEALFRYTPYRIKEVHRLGRLFNRAIEAKLRTAFQTTLKEYAASVWDISENPADRLDMLLRWANVGVTPTFNMITCLWPLVKERNLYFDNDIDATSLKIPALLRGKGLLHKWILFHLDKKLSLLPDANTFLPPLFPVRAKNLAKKVRPWIGRLRRLPWDNKASRLRLGTSGSWPLLHELYRKDVRYRDQIERLIFDLDIFPPDIFDVREIKKTWEVFLAGDLGLSFEVETLRSFGSLQRIIRSPHISL